MASRVPAGSHGVMPIFSDAMHFKQWYHAAPSFINLSIDPGKVQQSHPVPRPGRERGDCLRLQPGADFAVFRRDV
jgi:hypothetical protein